MILCDAGPLISLINRRDPKHSACRSVLGQLRPPLTTTWPCVTEAMHLLGSYGGYRAQDELWGYLEDGLLSLHLSTPEEGRRMRVLMSQYRDTPMDLADASLVAAAEVTGVRRVFTLDSHFRAYRVGPGAEPFDVVP